MATDSRSESAGKPRLSCTASPMATGGDHCGASASQMPMVCAREVLDERPHTTSRPDEGREAPAAVAVATLWADVPADILGTVLRLLPCLADRASVRSVCRHWRAAARVQALPAPLPVLVLPRFRFSCLTSDGALTAARRGLMPVELAGDDVRVVGSCDDWLVAVRPSRDVNMKTIGECFLVNAFSSEVVHLPRLQRPSKYSCLDVSSSARPIRGSFVGTRKREPWLHRSAILSASPSSGSKYTVAALSYNSAAKFRGLALWQPGMTSWYLCRSAGMNIFSDDLAFYQGKLYVVCKTRPKTIAFELREDEHGVSLSCPKEYTIDPHPLMPFKPSCWMRCNMVVWRGKLLLIMRFFSRYTYKMEYKPHSVEVFALDFSTSPCGFTQIHNFDGDCIFVDTYVCRSFSLGLHVEVQGDLIYFSDECIDDRFPYVYNMRDGTVRHFAAGLPLANSRVPEERYIGLPIWIFPPRTKGGG